jgi:hypothetical protein
MRFASALGAGGEHSTKRKRPFGDHEPVPNEISTIDFMVNRLKAEYN